MRTTSTGDGPQSVLGRATAILEAFASDDGELSLVTLALRTGIAKTTVYRIANTLSELGLLERLDGGYRLGIHLFELGERVTQQRELRQLALPYMEDLYEATHDVVHLAVLQGVEVLYFAKISGRRSAHFPTRVGGRMAAHCTALGKVIAAYSDPSVLNRILDAGLSRVTAHTICVPQVFVDQLAQIKAAGYSIEREEAVIGNCCVAAPLLGKTGQPVAAISVGVLANGFDPERLGLAVRTAALALSRELSRGNFSVRTPAVPNERKAR